MDKPADLYMMVHYPILKFCSPLSPANIQKYHISMKHKNVADLNKLNKIYS